MSSREAMSSPINGLSKIEYRKEGKWNRWTKLDVNQIIEGLNAYKQYPKETEYIIQHYLRVNPEYKMEVCVPSVKNVERFLNDRQFTR